MKSPDDERAAPDSSAQVLSSRGRRTRRTRVKRGAPRWLERSATPAVPSSARTDLPAEPPATFDDHDERFFAAEEGSLAPSSVVDRVAVSELALEEQEAETDDVPVASPRRRAFARYVGAVFIVALGVCIAAFAGAPSRLTAAASTPAPAAAAPAEPVPAAEPAMAAVPAEPARAAEPASPPEPAPSAAADPLAARAAREKARTALGRGDLARAISIGIEAVELDPSDAEAWLVLGAAEMASGKSRESRATFAACTKLATRGPRHECSQMLMQ